MSDFNLLGFLNINVPNEPLTPIIIAKKENSRILTPLNKPEPSTPKKSPELGNRQRSPQLDSSSLTPKNARNSPFFRTTYGQSFGTESPANSSPTDADADQVPDTPNSVSSVSSISSTISQCNDCECDDCLTRKQQADKRALAAQEKELERLGFNESVRKQQEEIAQERKKEEERRERERQERVQDMERLRAQRDAERAQKEQEVAEDAAMLRDLSKVDNSALEATEARNREYRGALYNQIGDDRARHAAETEQSKQQGVGSLGFGEDQDAIDAKRRAATHENARVLEQQIAEKRSGGSAERAADAEQKKRFVEEEAAYQAQKAAEAEQKKARDAELLKNNKSWLADKKSRAEAAEEEEKEYRRIRAELDRQKDEEDKRKADEKKRAELEALHRQLAEQVQRRKDALQQAREEEKVYVAHAAKKKKKPTLIHCVDCERDLTADHFSTVVVTPNGKIYKRSKAAPKNSPLHKYLHVVKEAQPYDFGHGDS